MYQKKKGPSKMKQDDLEAAEAREREAAEQARLLEEEAKRKEEVHLLTYLAFGQYTNVDGQKSFFPWITLPLEGLWLSAEEQMSKGQTVYLRT